MLQTMRDHLYYVYILASQKQGTLYIGVINNLVRRIYGHRNHLVKGFTKEYNVYKLVYFEATPSIESAIQREKHLKKWERQWKINLIEKANPHWNDLYQNII